jgi:hypothetical protein
MNKDAFRLVFLENDSEFFTNSPFKLLAWSTAVEFYDYDSGTANDIAELCYKLYTSFDEDINAISLIDFICSDYEQIPDDYKDIKDLVIENIQSWGL